MIMSGKKDNDIKVSVVNDTIVQSTLIDYDNIDLNKFSVYVLKKLNRFI